MNVRRLTFLLAVVVLVEACETGGSSDLAALRSEAHDSAGITIVDNERPSDESRMAWSVSDAPLVSIGTLDGDANYQLFQVNAGIRLSDGRFALSNNGTSQVRFYDPTGTFLNEWGGNGEGPGEFTGLSSLVELPGDSLMTWDFRQRRLTVFDGDGNPIRTITIQGSEDLRSPQFLARLSDGSLLVMASAIFGDSENLSSGLTRADRPYARVDMEGAVVGSLGVHPGDERMMTVGEGTITVMSHPFGRASLSAVWGSDVLINPNDTYELRAYDVEGQLTRIIRRDHAPVPMTQAHLDMVIAQRLEGLDDTRRARLAQNYEGMPLMESFPAFSQTVVDRLGYVWVREFEMPGEVRRIWTVFDPEGAVQGFIETPADLQIWEIGDDFILGRTTDDFDVEYVQMWGLTRNASGATN